tara:strand:- start:67 stop:597 length:531 start_codon:yes stop_codon:yes gene_type:complete
MLEFFIENALVSLVLTTGLITIPFLYTQLFSQEKIKDKQQIINSLKKIYPNLKNLSPPVRNGEAWIIELDPHENEGISKIECVINPDGYSKVLSEFYFKKGSLLSGVNHYLFSSKEYYDDGVLRSESIYNKDTYKKEGLEKFYYQNGKLERIWEWKNGTVSSAECWDKEGNKIECN